MRRILILFPIILFLASACAPAAVIEATATPPAPTAAPSLTPALPSPTPPPTAEPAPQALPNPQYHLRAELDYDRHTVGVQQTIRYTNRTGQELPDLRLMVPPDQYPGVFTLQSLTWEDGTSIEAAGWQENHVLVIPRPLAAGEHLTIGITFRLALPSPAQVVGERPVPFGYKERQTNLVDWYPYVPPYIPGEGWLAHPPGYYGEHLVFDLADFTVDLRLRSARPLAAAASSREEDGSNENERRYRLENARNFAISLSPDYVVTREQAGGIEVISYASPIHAAAGQAAGRVTAEAALLFSDLFGPLPRSQISVVEADFLDGMEFDGLYFLSDGFYNLYQGVPGEYLTAIAAHETAHQWWYASVANDQALEPWLDEALSTYSEYLYYEALYPDALRWWWDVRVNFYQPEGWVDSSIYDHIGQSRAYIQYRNAVYLNGAVFFHDLRQAVGDEAFFAVLKDYAQSSAGRIATRADFFTVLARHTSADITPLLEKYFKTR